MKKLLRFFVVPFLALLSRGVLRRYRPKIVMVTGSVGKTSTKDAIAAVLSARFLVRKSEKSFNSEFGVPFTILGVGNPWTNPLAWLSVVKRALALLILPNHYPTMLVLEVGADRPGDLARMLRTVTPDAVVVTRLPEIPVHVEAYASPEEVREEEFSPALYLAPGAPLVVSADDPYALDAAKRVPARIITYGRATGADVVLGEPDFILASEGRVEGMHAPLIVEGMQYDLSVHGSVGATQVFPAAAAVAIGTAFDIAPADALRGLESYEPPAGRGRLLRGKNGSIIIDDSYNSSPVAVEQALATLAAFPKAKRRIAVLGDMLELGRYSVEEHARIGALARKVADVVIAVGIRARAFVGEHREAGTVVVLDNAKQAAETLLPGIEEGDVFLIKGSQSVRTERIAEALLADPADAQFLVRQEKRWRAIA